MASGFLFWFAFLLLFPEGPDDVAVPEVPPDLRELFLLALVIEGIGGGDISPIVAGGDCWRLRLDEARRVFSPSPRPEDMAVEDVSLVATPGFWRLDREAGIDAGSLAFAFFDRWREAGPAAG